MGTVHQFPPVRNQQAGTAEQKLADALRTAVDAKVGTAATFEEREVVALELSNEATRLFLQCDLAAIADNHPSPE